jgi:hypothetical protein
MTPVLAGELMMASLAHAEHPTGHHARQRAEIAAQGHEHLSFVIDSVIAFVKRSSAAIGARIEKWSQAHHQAVQDRIFWELALSDHALMEELRAARARSAGQVRE